MLARNLNGMREKFPEQYSFYPKTWLLPKDQKLFKEDCEKMGDEDVTFIIKPEAGAQGKGIYLAKDLHEIDLFDHCVV